MKGTYSKGLVRISDTELSTLRIALRSLLSMPRDELCQLIAAESEADWRDKYGVATAMVRLAGNIDALVGTK